MNISNDKMKQLIDMASKNMGISQQEFEQKLKNKNFNNPQVNELLNNPEKAKAMMKNPNIQNMIKKFLGTE